MQELFLKDSNQVEPEAADILSDELVTYLDGVNTTLGTKDDPRFGEYQDFLDSINEASILKIEPDQMSSGKYDGLDLTGEDGVSEVAIKEPEDENFFNGLTIENYVKMAFFATPFTQDMGKVYDKEYASVMKSQFALPEFKLIS